MNRIEFRRDTHVEDIGDGAGLFVDGYYLAEVEYKETRL